MKCQKCGINHANVNYTRIINGERMELHLCDACAQKMHLQVNAGFGLGNMFSHFFDDFSEMNDFSMPSLFNLTSLNHSLFEDIPFFKNDFYFGGNRLIESTDDELDNVLANIQKKHYADKKKKEEKPKNTNEKIKDNSKITDKKQKEIQDLKAKMQEYVQKEEYEKAAVLRDRIKKLES